MAENGFDNSMQSSQDALFKKIESAASKLPTNTSNEAFHTAKSLVNLSAAWRHLAGGQQPGGGCNCSNK